MTLVIAEASDAVQITQMIVTLIGTTIVGVLTYLTLCLNKRADEAKIAVQQVKDTLVITSSIVDDKLQGIATTGDLIHSTGESTHSLVNSAMGNVLRMLAEVSRAKATDSHTAVDEAAAIAAEKAYIAHQDAQALIDNPKTPKIFSGDDTMRAALRKLNPHSSNVSKPDSLK